MTNLTYINADIYIDPLLANKLVEITLAKKLTDLKATDPSVASIEIVTTDDQCGDSVSEKPEIIFSNTVVDFLMPVYYLLSTSCNTGTTNHKCDIP